MSDDYDEHDAFIAQMRDRKGEADRAMLWGCGIFIVIGFLIAVAIAGAVHG